MAQFCKCSYHFAVLASAEC